MGWLPRPLVARGPGGLPRDFLGPPGGFLGASWGPPGGFLGPLGGLLGYSWGPLGCLVASRPIFNRCLGPFLGPTIVESGLAINFKNEHRFGFICLAILVPLGVVWGSILDLFWARFWAPQARGLISENRAPAAAGARFSRFRGTKHEPNMAPKTASSSNVAPRAFWGPLEFDVEQF